MKRKKTKIRNDIEKFDYMKTNKDNIKNIVKNDEILTKLNDIVINVQKIVIHTYIQFYKIILLVFI